MKLWFLAAVPFSALQLFIPAIVSGLGYTSLKAQLMTVPPYAVAYFVSLLVAWSADRYNTWVLISDGECESGHNMDFVLTSFLISRSLNAAGCALIAAIGFIALATLPPDAYVVGQSFTSYRV